MDGVELRGRFLVDEDRVVIEYRVENYRDQDVYLTDVSIRVGPQGPYRDLESPFVLQGEDDEAVLASYLLPWPPGTRWSVPPTVYTTRVLAGRLVEGSLAARRPLRTLDLDQRYRREIAQETREVDCQVLRFDLGVIPHSDSLFLRDLTIAGLAVAELSMNALQHQEVLSFARRGHAVSLTRRA